MLESTTTPKQEQSTTCTNVPEQEAKQDYGRNLKTERIEWTPFTLVYDNHRPSNENCFLAIGEHRITEWKCQEELEIMITNRDWMLLANTTIQWVLNVLATMDENKKIKQEIKTNNKTI